MCIEIYCLEFSVFINELHIKVILITNLNYSLDLQHLRNKLFSKLNVEDLYRVATIVCNMGILGNPSSGLNVLNYPDVKLLMKYNTIYKSFMDLLRYYLNTTCTSDSPQRFYRAGFSAILIDLILL